MDFNKSRQPLAILGVTFLLGVGCSDSFSRRVANSTDASIHGLNSPDISLFGFWNHERSLHLLQTATITIKTNGIISHAIVSTVNQEGLKGFQITYLSKNANVREIVVMKGGEIIFSRPPPHQKFARAFAKQYVEFVEEIYWRAPDNPLQGYRTEDLTVKLVKDDGKIIGPAGILSDKDLWEEIRSKMLTDKKWQEKFPWLHDRLLQDPSMPPMWVDPERLPPKRTGVEEAEQTRKVW